MFINCKFNCDVFVERMERIESSDRAEVTRLIELQSRLIHLTIHQSNASIHDEYIDKLTESTHDLTSKLKQLELDLKTIIRDSESKLENDVSFNFKDSFTGNHDYFLSIPMTADIMLLLFYHQKNRDSDSCYIDADTFNILKF